MALAQPRRWLQVAILASGATLASAVVRAESFFGTSTPADYEGQLALADEYGASGGVLVRYQSGCCSHHDAHGGSCAEEIIGDEMLADESLADGVGEPSLGPEQFAATGMDTISIQDAVGGYMDSPIVGNQFRFRVDAAYDNFVPDRAEFFYAKCGCFATLPRQDPLFDPRAVGPPLPEEAVDYQDLSTYLEFAPFQRLSFFVEAPVRFIDPVVNANEAGIADVNTGFKYALISRPGRYLTFQMRAYAPSGNPFDGLGTNNVNLEPGFLALRRFGDRLWLQGEVRHWIPIEGTDFAGNVLRYGMGFGFDLYRSCNSCCGCRGLRITPVTEVVGWSVMGGKKLERGQVFDAEGDTIVNVKVGTRVTWGRNSIYGGYGHAVTHDTWYRDIARLEYRWAF